MLTKPVKGCSQFQSWPCDQNRAGMNKPSGAGAPLAVIMHRMLADGTSFNAAAAAA